MEIPQDKIDLKGDKESLSKAQSEKGAQNMFHPRQQHYRTWHSKRKRKKDKKTSPTSAEGNTMIVNDKMDALYGQIKFQVKEESGNAAKLPKNSDRVIKKGKRRNKKKRRGLHMFSLDTGVLNPILHNIVGWTELLLKSRKQKHFIKTEATDAVLNRVTQNGIAIICGLPGSGKTEMGFQVMADIMSTDQAIPVKINTAAEFQMAIDVARKYIIFIDNIFGETTFCKQRLDQWVPLFEIILMLIKFGICNVIITSRVDILNEAKKYLPHGEFSETNIFCDSHIVDLSKEFKLSNDEKKRIIGCLITETTPTIQEQLLKSTYQTYLGFPLLCKLFTEKLTLYKSSLKQTKSITAYTVCTVENLYYTEKHKYLTLVFMALNETFKLDKNILVKLTSKTEDLLKLIAELSWIPFDRGFVNHLIDAADSLSGVFVTYHSHQETFEFSNVCIQEAVCISFGNRHPGIVLQSCTDEFVQKFVTTKIRSAEDNKTSLRVPVSQFQILAERLVTILTTNFKDANDISALDDIEFVDFFFNFLFDESKLESFIKETVQSPLATGARSIIFYCTDKPHFLLWMLLQLHSATTKDSCYEQEIIDAFKYCYENSKKESVDVIRRVFANACKDIHSKLHVPKRHEDGCSDDSDYHSMEIPSVPGKISTETETDGITSKTAFKEIDRDIADNHNVYLYEIKVDVDQYPRMHSLQSQLEKEFDADSTLSKFDSIKSTIDVKNLWGISSLYIYSPVLISMEQIRFFFPKTDVHIQKLTRVMSKRHVHPLPVNRPCSVIIFVEVNGSSKDQMDSVQLTAESINVIKLLGSKMNATEISKAIFVINTDQLQTLEIMEDISTIDKVKTSIEDVEAFPKEVKIFQYNCFLMDEFQLPNWISRCLESELDQLVTKFSNIASKANLHVDATCLEKCFEDAKSRLDDHFPLAVKIILSRYGAVNSYYVKDGKLCVRVSKEGAIDERLLKQETGYSIEILLDSNSRRLIKHVRPGSKIFNRENRNTYGTLGCFGKMDNDILIGFTSGHLVKDTNAVYTGEGKLLGLTSDTMSVGEEDDIVDALIDVAAFEIDYNRRDECQNSFYCPNGQSISLNVFEGQDMSRLEGKVLFKHGATSYVTHGVFSRVEERRFHNSSRRNHFRREYIVRSLDPKKPFGCPGDSGSLVCFHDPDQNSTYYGVFFYIGSYDEDKDEYVCCLAGEALDALHAKKRKEFALAEYTSFGIINRKTKASCVQQMRSLLNVQPVPST